MKLLTLVSACLLLSISSDNQIKKLEKFLSKNYAKIPSGVLEYEGEKYTLGAFYIYKTELSVLDYKEFLADLEREGVIDQLNNIDPCQNIDDSSEFFRTYFEHPAMHDYPIMNISIHAAQKYCEWLGTKLSSNFDIDPSKIEVNLPTKSQWIYAAKGGHHENIYGWNGPYLRNSEGKFLANFKKEISQELITLDEDSQEYKIVDSPFNTSTQITSPVKAYLPNDFGVYNMSGNVAELVYENNEAKIMGGSYKSPGYDIRVTSELNYKSADAYTGFRPVVIIKE